MKKKLLTVLKKNTDCTNPGLLKGVKAAIFDMDGTLLDSMTMWSNVPFLYLEQKGIKNIPDRKQLWDEFKVLSLQDAAKIFQKKYGFEQDCQKIIEEIDDLVYEQYAKVIQAKPGVKKFLSALKKAKIPCGMATATDRRCVEVALANLKLSDYIDTIATCSEAGASKDNNPAVYDMIAQRFSCKREECIVFEDALHGVRTARAAGYKVLAVEDSVAVESHEWEISCSIAHSRLTKWWCGK